MSTLQSRPKFVHDHTQREEAYFVAQRLKELLTGASALLESPSPNDNAVTSARHAIREANGVAFELLEIIGINQAVSQ